MFLLLEKQFCSLSIGLELSQALITQPTVGIQDWLIDFCRAKNQSPILLTDVDLLFHPSMQIDPVALFRLVSHSLQLIVLFPGTFNNGTLTYSEPIHAHYRTWRDLSDMTIITGGLHEISRLSSV